MVKRPVGVGLGPPEPPAPLSYIGTSKYDEQLSHVAWQLRSLEAELKATLLAQELLDPKPRLRAERKEGADASAEVAIKPHVPIWTPSDTKNFDVEEVANLPDVGLPALHIHHHYHKHVHHYRRGPPALLPESEDSVSGLETSLPVLAHVHHHTHELPPPRESFAPSEELLALVAAEREKRKALSRKPSEEDEDWDDGSSVGSSVGGHRRDEGHGGRGGPGPRDPDGDKRGPAPSKRNSFKFNKWDVKKADRARLDGNSFNVKDLEPAQGWQVPPFLEWCEVDTMPVTPPEDGLRKDLKVLFHAAHTPHLGERDYLKKRNVEKRLYRYWGQQIPPMPVDMGKSTPRQPQSPKPARAGSDPRPGPARVVKISSKVSSRSGLGAGGAPDSPARTPRSPSKPPPQPAPAPQPASPRRTVAPPAPAPVAHSTTRPGPAAPVQDAIRTSFRAVAKGGGSAAPAKQRSQVARGTVKR